MDKVNHILIICYTGWANLLRDMGILMLMLYINPTIAEVGNW